MLVSVPSLDFGFAWPLHQVNAKQTLSNVNKDLRQSGGTPGDPSCQGQPERPSIQMGCFGFMNSPKHRQKLGTLKGEQKNNIVLKACRWWNVQTCRWIMKQWVCWLLRHSADTLRIKSLHAPELFIHAPAHSILSQTQTWSKSPISTLQNFRSLDKKHSN